MSKTRYERKREKRENFISGLVVAVVFFLITLFLCGMACKTWCEHPAEQPISYEEYMERFGGANA